METDSALHCSVACRGYINDAYTSYGKPVLATDKDEQLILIATVNGTFLIVSYYTIL